MKICLVLLLAWIAQSSLWAGNPIITSIYTADPTARVFRGALYLYPSHDPDDAKWWDMVDYHVFRTRDLQSYQDLGVAFSLKDVPWAKKHLWAPDCVQRNGKYYLYFPVDKTKIGVAVSRSPRGPFRDALGRPLISMKGTPGAVSKKDFIDPSVLIDDDGQAYLFAGMGVVNAVKLNADMTSFSGPVRQIQGVKGFFEAVWVHKYRGKYYMSYSGQAPWYRSRQDSGRNGEKGRKPGKGSGKGPGIHYATADHPLGPYTYRGMILDAVNSGTNHHSIVQYRGRWYFFYHTADLSRSRIPEGAPERKYAGFRRSVAVEELHYNPDGTIQPITPTRAGVKPAR